MINQSSQTFLSQSGAELFSTTFSNEKENDNDFHFVFLHGALDHHSFHVRFYNYILETYPGAAISAYDYPGHGKSGGARAHIDSFETYTKDLSFFLSLISQNHRYKKLILVGYSMGGLISMDYLQRYPIPGVDGVVLVNPCLKLGSSSYGSFLDKIQFKQLGVFSKFKIPSLSDGTELTNDEEVLRDIRSS